MVKGKPQRMVREAPDPGSQAKADIKDTFGWRVKQARMDAGLTQDQLAKQLDLGRTAVTQWELAGAVPAAKTIAAVAKVLNVKESFLAYGDTNEPVVLAPDPEKLGYALIDEVRFGVSKDDREKVNQWGLPTTWLRNELHVRSLDSLFVYTVDTAGGRYEYGDRLIVDGGDYRPSPPGQFLIWDGIGAVIGHLQVIPGGKKTMVKVTTEGAEPYETEMDRLQVIGRVKGVWRKV